MTRLSTSVIIASYLRAVRLACCLKSLASQVTMPDEVIVVWQADDVETKRLAEQFAEEAPFELKVVHQPEAGIVPAENTGLDAASGEIILLIDDDAIAPLDWVQRHLAHYEDPIVGAVGGPYMNHHPDGRCFESRQPSTVGKLAWHGRFIGNMFDHVDAWRTRPPSCVDHLAGGNMSLRRKAFWRFEEALKPYWQLFEADVCLQVKAGGFRVVFDWGNRIDHFPTNDVFIMNREGDLERKVFNCAYNHGFILAKHNRWYLKLVGLAYLWFVGSGANPGLLGFFRALCRFGRLRQELRILRGTLACHGRGWWDGRTKSTESPLHLLIYSHSFWPAVGGVETYARLLAEGTGVDRTFQTTVVTQTPHSGPDPKGNFRVLRRPAMHRLWQLVRAADVVFVAGPALTPMIFAVLARKPFVIEHHGYQAICPNGLLLNKVRGGVCAEAFRKKRYGECGRCVRVDRGGVSALFQLALTLSRRRLCRRAYTNVAVSDHVRKRHDLEGMQVIYHGIPDQPRLAGTVTVELGGKEVHFGYVGRLVEEKGLSLLVEAAGKLKSRGVRHRLSFIGDGPLKDSLRVQAEAAGLNGEVRFTGFLEGPALQRATADVDVVVMPSIWEETAGLAAMEQMMRGRVVLAADIGGLGEVVGDGGVKFRPFDSDDLAKRMVELTKPELRWSIGEAARERASRLFCLERMVSEHKALFRDACRPHGGLKQHVF